MLLDLIAYFENRPRTVWFNSDGHEGHSVPVATVETKKQARDYIARRSDPKSYSHEKQG